MVWALAEQPNWKLRKAPPPPHLVQWPTSLLHADLLPTKYEVPGRKYRIPDSPFHPETVPWRRVVQSLSQVPIQLSQKTRGGPAIPHLKQAHRGFVSPASALVLPLCNRPACQVHAPAVERAIQQQQAVLLER